MRRLILVLTLALLPAVGYTLQRDRRPDVRLTQLAVRATVFAIPSPTPLIIEVTRVVEVTRIVEVTRLVEVAAPPTVTPTATLTATNTPLAASAAPVPEVSAAAFAAPVSEPQAAAKAAPAPQPTAPPAAVVQTADTACPAASANQYTTIPVGGPAADRPDSLHGDLNLALRGYVPADAGLSLVDINGPTDGDPPQLAAILAGRASGFTSTYRVRDWNWGCAEHGCRGDELANVEVSLVGLQATPGEALYIPGRGAEIYGGGFTALVLYADPQRITLVYTREDTVANGYSVHLEDFCVDPNLVASYQAANAAGRGSLPALRNGEPVGTARYNQALVAVRDRGTFTDPRSRKDWWRGY